MNLGISEYRNLGTRDPILQFRFPISYEYLNNASIKCQTVWSTRAIQLSNQTLVRIGLKKKIYFSQFSLREIVNRMLILTNNLLNKVKN